MIASINQDSTEILTLEQAQNFAQKSQLQYLQEEILLEEPNVQKDLIEFVCLYKKFKGSFIYQDIVNSFCVYKDTKTLYKKFSEIVFPEQTYFFVVYEEKSRDGSSRDKFLPKQHFTNYKNKHGEKITKKKHYYFHIDLMLYLIQNCENLEAQKTSLIITKLLRIYDDYGDK